MNRIILASASPRRKELLGHISDNFDVVVSSVEEIVPPNIPQDEVPQFLATLKAKDVAKNHIEDLVIGADTCVLCDGIILGKPKDREAAYKMLSSLSGKTHTVITGCSLVKNNRSISFSVSTEVEFYTLTDKEINEYIETNEPFDKAGGYGIQGKGSLLVKGIKGDYFNVVGLPIAKLKRVINLFWIFNKKALDNLCILLYNNKAELWDARNTFYCVSLHFSFYITGGRVLWQ